MADVNQVLADPEFQRLWNARRASGRKTAGTMVSGRSNWNALDPESRAINDYLRSLGGLDDRQYFYVDDAGNPAIGRHDSFAGALGKAGLYTGLGAAAAFGAPALLGAAGAGGGAGAAGASAATSAAGTAAAGAGTAAAAGGVPWLPIIGAASGGASAAGQAISANKQRQSEKDRLALEESTLNPFRQQLAQAKSIGQLDMMEHAPTRGTRLSAPTRYAAAAGDIDFRPSYAPSADVRSSAAALKQDVMAGNTAPRIGDPKNRGRSAVLDLLRIAAARR